MKPAGGVSAGFMICVQLFTRELETVFRIRSRSTERINSFCAHLLANFPDVVGLQELSKVVVLLHA